MSNLENLANSSDRTIYVGTMEFPFRNFIMFHMASPNVEALHEMAEKLGLKRSWFQDEETIKGSGKCLLPHYDISKSKKTQAIKLGAVEVNDRELIDRCYPEFNKLMDKK